MCGNSEWKGAYREMRVCCGVGLRFPQRLSGRIQEWFHRRVHQEWLEKREYRDSAFSYVLESSFNMEMNKILSEDSGLFAKDGKADQAF